MQARLQFEGIRCFATKQDAILRPLTLLVGENSTGKSTFLALCNIVSGILSLATTPSFNDPPFLLGAYDDIASRGIRGAQGRKFFLISMNVDACGAIEAKFVPRDGQPFLESWRLSAQGTSVTLQLDAASSAVTSLWESARGARVIKGMQETQWRWTWALLWEKENLGVSEAVRKELREVVSNSDLRSLQKTLRLIALAFGRAPYAFAPMRTNPRRTYDPVMPVAKPEGSHIPMLLAEMSFSRSKEWRQIRSGLKEFGIKSGLFDQVDVIRKGQKLSDPFQIGVKSGGGQFNLVDVGYGVSQVLPLIVDTLQRSGVNDLFLMQQPEVHLHPHAQAELGGYFARQARKNVRFVIETHSDYIVDRIRTEVRRKTLGPQDVSLLYFERTKRGAVIHNLELDKDGSITNAPKGYRQFFLDEENRLLDI